MRGACVCGACVSLQSWAGCVFQDELRFRADEGSIVLAGYVNSFAHGLEHDAVNLAAELLGEVPVLLLAGKLREGVDGGVDGGDGDPG